MIILLNGRRSLSDIPICLHSDISNDALISKIFYSCHLHCVYRLDTIAESLESPTPIGFSIAECRYWEFCSGIILSNRRATKDKKTNARRYVPKRRNAPNLKIFPVPFHITCQKCREGAPLRRELPKYQCHDAFSSLFVQLKI